MAFSEVLEFAFCILVLLIYVSYFLLCILYLLLFVVPVLVLTCYSGIRKVYGSCTGESVRLSLRKRKKWGLTQSQRASPREVGADFLRHSYRELSKEADDLSKLGHKGARFVNVSAYLLHSPFWGFYFDGPITPSPFGGQLLAAV